MSKREGILDLQQSFVSLNYRHFLFEDFNSVSKIALKSISRFEFMVNIFHLGNKKFHCFFDFFLAPTEFQKCGSFLTVYMFQCREEERKHQARNTVASDDHSKPFLCCPHHDLSVIP